MPIPGQQLLGRLGSGISSALAEHRDLFTALSFMVRGGARPYVSKATARLASDIAGGVANEVSDWALQSIERRAAQGPVRRLFGSLADQMRLACRTLQMQYRVVNTSYTRDTLMAMEQQLRRVKGFDRDVRASMREAATRPILSVSNYYDQIRGELAPQIEDELIRRRKLNASRSVWQAIDRAADMDARIQSQMGKARYATFAAPAVIGAIDLAEVLEELYLPPTFTSPMVVPVRPTVNGLSQLANLPIVNPQGAYWLWSLMYNDVGSGLGSVLGAYRSRLGAQVAASASGNQTAGLMRNILLRRRGV